MMVYGCTIDDEDIDAESDADHRCKSVEIQINKITSELELTGGRVAGELGANWGRVYRERTEIFLEYSSKNVGFYAFLLRKLYLGPETRTRGV